VSFSAAAEPSHVKTINKDQSRGPFQAFSGSKACPRTFQWHDCAIRPLIDGRGGLRQAVVAGVSRGLRAVGGADLVKDIADVAPHSVGADDEFVGDLLVALARNDVP
jgi:hypothetical protein